MRDPALDAILNPPHEEIHTTECAWHRDWHACDCGIFEDMSARSSEEEQRLPKPEVAGSNPAERDLAEHELKLAQATSRELIRDCPEHVQLFIHTAFETALICLRRGD